MVPGKYLINLFQIAEIDTMGKTDIVRAGRHKPIINAMVAKITFLGDPFLLIKCDNVVGTCFYT